MEDLEPEIIPLCIYKTFDKKFFLTCEKDVCNPRQGMTHYKTYYVINPNSRPLPKGNILFKITNASYVTLSIDQIHDNYNENEGMNFIAWSTYAKGTIPLYYKNKKDGIVLSDKKEDKVMYVLENKEENFSVDDNGRCVPDKDGMKFNYCVVNYVQQKVIDKEIPRVFKSLELVETKKKENKGYIKKRDKPYVLYITLLFSILAFIIIIING